MAQTKRLPTSGYGGKRLDPRCKYVLKPSSLDKLFPVLRLGCRLCMLYVMASVERAVEAREGALTDTSEVLEGMVAALREAGDAALALQKSKCVHEAA